MRLIYTLMILALVVPFGAQAQVKEPTPPKTLQDFVNQGAQLYYLGAYEKMHGWVLINQGKPTYFYENPARTALVSGLLFDKDGQMITMAQLGDLKRRVGDEMYATTSIPKSTTPEPTEEIEVEESLEQTDQLESPVQVPTPQPADEGTPDDATEESESESKEETTDASQVQSSADEGLATPIRGRAPTQAERMYVDLVKANWFTINPEGEHDVFAFIDPDCSHCQEFIRTSDDFIEQGKIRLRVIPVGVSDEGARRSAVLLASANPDERLKNYVEGDTDALPAPKTINLDAVDDNTNVMIKHRFDVTPVVVYRTKQGKIRMIRGRPTSYDNILQDIAQN